ncbi:Uncharacterised protein [Mycobacterium tuberculosis]|nr:Uncharacterised protein [Mycobacterium tuberculosis]
MPAYVVYPVDSEREVIASAIDIMHRLASSATKSKTAAKPVKRTKR